MFKKQRKRKVLVVTALWICVCSSPHPDMCSMVVGESYCEPNVPDRPRVLSTPVYRVVPHSASPPNLREVVETEKEGGREGARERKKSGDLL